MDFILKKIRLIREQYLIETIILILISIILISTLFIYPIFGKSDNGDFGRLMIYGGLSNISNRYKDIYDGYFHLNYIISDPWGILPINVDWVSGSVLLKIAVLLFSITHLFLSNLFDVRYLAFTYCIVFLIGIFLILSYKGFSKPIKIAAGIIIIFIFTDVSYISYFNSFFGEAGTIVFFFLNIGTYLHLISKDVPKVKDFVWFFIASGAFLTGKAQNIPLLAFMLIIYVSLFIYYKEKRQRKAIIIGALLVTVICIGSLISITKTMNQNNLYQAVFSGVLRGSKSPEKDLKELGLNKSLEVYEGHSFYVKNAKFQPMGSYMETEFYPHISSFKVLFFYFAHPDRMWQKIVESANNAYAFYLPGRSNFIKGQVTFDSNGKVIINKPINDFRSKLIDYLKKHPIVKNNIFTLVPFCVVFFIIVIIDLIKNKNKERRLLNLMLLFVLATASSQLILPEIGSGHGDLGKHLFLMNLAFDAMMCISLLWILHIILKVVELGENRWKKRLK